MSHPDLCRGQTKAGEPCGFRPRRLTGYCVNHDPTYSEQQRANARRAGQVTRGIRQRLLTAPADIDISTHAGVQEAIAAVLRLQIAGVIEPARARVLLRALNLATHNLRVSGNLRRANPNNAVSPDRVDALDSALRARIMAHEAPTDGPHDAHQ